MYADTTEYYQQMAERDERAAELKRRFPGMRVRKSSRRGIVLSPEYIENYRGSTTPNGFGGLAAQYHGVLYVVSWDR